MMSEKSEISRFFVRKFLYIAPSSPMKEALPVGQALFILECIFPLLVTFCKHGYLQLRDD